MRAYCSMIIGLLAVAPLAAQHADSSTAADSSALPEGTSFEIGTLLGISFLANDAGITEQTATSISAPGYGIFASPTIYVSVVNNSLLFEPQFSLMHLSGSNAKTTSAVGLGISVGYLTQPRSRQSPYVAAGASFISLNDAGSHQQGPALGVEGGYRWKVGPGFAVRVSGRFRRWFGDLKQINELGFGVGLGGLIK